PSWNTRSSTIPAARARTWAVREASTRPGSSVVMATGRGITVTTPTSGGGGGVLAVVGSLLQATRTESASARAPSVCKRPFVLMNTSFYAGTSVRLGEGGRAAVACCCWRILYLFTRECKQFNSCENLNYDPGHPARL